MTGTKTCGARAVRRMRIAAGQSIVCMYIPWITPSYPILYPSPTSTHHTQLGALESLQLPPLHIRLAQCVMLEHFGYVIAPGWAHSIVVLIFGRYFGIKGSIIIIISSIFITSIISIICYYEIIYSNSSISIYIKPFIKDDIIENNIVFIYDAISISFVITIVLISFNVYIFTIYYMSTDAHLVRFYIYMYLFTTSMIFLVITNSYISIFIG